MRHLNLDFADKILVNLVPANKILVSLAILALNLAAGCVNTGVKNSPDDKILVPADKNSPVPDKNSPVPDKNNGATNPNPGQNSSGKNPNSPIPPISPPTPVPPIADILPPFAKNVTCSGHPWLPEWNTFTAEAVTTFGVHLLTGDLAIDDIQALCPKYYQATQPQKLAFWALFVAAVACPESDYKVTSSMKESFGVYSNGLLQVSYEDVGGHKRCELKREPGTTAEQNRGNAFDPRINIRCGVAILDDQLAKDHGLVQPTWAKRYYWSTLNKERGWHKTLDQYNKYSGQLNFCR